jgi:hypothetical protein
MNAAAAPPCCFPGYGTPPLRVLTGAYELSPFSWLGREQPELSESREVVFHDRER